MRRQKKEIVHARNGNTERNGITHGLLGKAYVDGLLVERSVGSMAMLMTMTRDGI